MNRHILRALLLACSGCAVMPAWGQDAVSGYAYLTPEMQEMQDYNFANPGMLTVEAGKRLFHTRWGQVDIACHQCHDYHASKTFRGQLLTQGQSNGFPVYRFTMGQVVGLQERISECLIKLCAPSPIRSARRNTPISRFT